MHRHDTAEGLAKLRIVVLTNVGRDSRLVYVGTCLLTELVTGRGCPRTGTDTVEQLARCVEVRIGLLITQQLDEVAERIRLLGLGQRLVAERIDRHATICE